MNMENSIKVVPIRQCDIVDKEVDGEKFKTLVFEKDATKFSKSPVVCYLIITPKGNNDFQVDLKTAEQYEKETINNGK